MSSREELWDCLEEIASNAFYANCSRDSGEFVEECDSWGIVEHVLSDYEDQLVEFFGEE